MAIDSLRIDFDPFTSFGWNFLLAKNKVWFTYDPDYDPADNEYTRLFKLTDADPTDPYSDIVTLDTFNFGDYGLGRTQHFSLNYSGQILFNAERADGDDFAVVGVIDQNFNLLDTLHYAIGEDEITYHNAFPVAEDNSFYIVTTSRLIR
ncbi:MAG: hypothetical protein WBA17_10670, partial [Saprospiraceae bacterium]